MNKKHIYTIIAQLFQISTQQKDNIKCYWARFGENLRACFGKHILELVLKTTFTLTAAAVTNSTQNKIGGLTAHRHRESPHRGASVAADVLLLLIWD